MPANNKQASLKNSSEAKGDVPFFKKAGRIIKQRLLLPFVCVAVTAAVTTSFMPRAAAVPPVREVQVQSVQRGGVSQVFNTSGLLVSARRATVYSSVTAPVSILHVEKGDYITEGEPLVSFDTTGLERELRVARANYSLAQARLDEARSVAAAGPPPSLDAGGSAPLEQLAEARQRLQNSQNSIDELEAALLDIHSVVISMQNQQTQTAQTKANAEAELAEILPLHNPQAGIDYSADIARLEETIEECARNLQELELAISAAQADIDFYTKALQDAARQKEDAEKELEILEGITSAEPPPTGAGSTPAEEIAQNAKIEQLEIQTVSPQVAFEIAAENFNAGKQGLQAPISGIVTGVYLQEDTVAKRYEALYTIESIDEVNVIIALSSQELEVVKEGQSATVTCQNRQYSASVMHIDAIATPGKEGETEDGAHPLQGGYIQATVSLLAPDSLLHLGVQADVRIHAARAAGVLLIPKAAVLQNAEETYCFVEENGVAVYRTLTTGIWGDDMVEVLEGVAENEKVILTPRGLTDGCAVLAAVNTNESE